MTFQPAPLGKSPEKALLPKAVIDLIALTNQLTVIFQRETAGLLAGDKDALKTWEADKARAMALYQRDMTAVKKDPDWARKLSSIARDKLTAAGAQLQKALSDQSRLIARRRHVTEGIVQAIAKDVAQKRQGVSPYAMPRPGRAANDAAPRLATAITLNAVV